MRDLVPEGVVRKLIGRIAQQKQTARRMNPARPLLQSSGLLEFLPVFRPIKNVKMRFALRDQVWLFQFLSHHPEIEFGFDRRARSNKASHIVIDEMFSL